MAAHHVGHDARHVHRLAYRACRAICVAAGVNAFACFVSSAVLGGTAYYGKAENGRYFLGQHAGDAAAGRMTEVGPGVYRYSLWHLRSVAVTSVLGIAAGLIAKGLKAEG